MYLLNPFHHKQVFLSLSLSICHYHPSLPACLPNYIQCPHRADVNRFLQVGQHWHLQVYRTIEQCQLWVCPFFSSSTPQVFYVLLGCFWRRKSSSFTDTVLLSGTFLCSSQLVCFFMCLVSVHMVNLYSSIISSDRLAFYLIDNSSISVNAFSRHILASLSLDEILLPSYVN